MKILRTLASGAVLYVVMAACGSSDRVSDVVAGDGGIVGSDGDVVDALVDALVNPVKEASAAEPPDVATEPCDKMLKYNNADWYVAEHAYPGKTAAELASVRVVFPTNALAGYGQQVTVGQFVKDGSAATICGPVSNGPPAFSYTFILPR